MTPPPGTRHAPSARADREAVARDARAIAAEEFIPPLLDAISSVAMILNAERQIVFANRVLLDSFATTLDQVIGLRLGEVVGCIHSGREPGGCGTGEACRFCGAVNAVLECQRTNGKVQGECRLTVAAGPRQESRELKVTATPFVVAGQNFIMVELTDISALHRRQALERIFYHDILNKAGVVENYLNYLVEADFDLAEIRARLPRILSVARQVTTELADQRELLAAESGELRTRMGAIRSREALEQAVEQYRVHEVARGRSLAVAPASEQIEFTTDAGLLNRVLGNLLKNALEATPEGGAVTASCRAVAAGVEFRVHNPGTITDAVRWQVFQRSFSTKGKDRGLGTYGLKLLTERYLEGTVGFTSTPGAGTEFWVTLPRGGGNPE